MNPDVVVVGAGITGSFTAYYLARAGLSTALVERAGVGNQASGINPGGLNPLHGPGIPGPMGDLALKSFALHAEMWDFLPVRSRAAFSPRSVTRLQLLHDGDDEADIGRILDLYASTEGFRVERLDRSGATEIEPRLHPDVTGGILTRGNRCVDGRAYTVAVAEAARASGAETVEGEVRGIRREEGRAVAVSLADGSTLSCGSVVVATGPWTEEWSRWLEFRIEVAPVMGQLLLAAVPGGIPCDLTRGLVGLYPLPGNRAWIGGTEEHCGFDGTPDRAGRETLLEGAASVLDGVAPEVLGHAAAFRPVTPDGMPVVGAVPGWENVILATGAGRKGMLLGAGMARATADLVLEGETSLPVGPCAPDRFRETVPRKRGEERAR